MKRKLTAIVGTLMLVTALMPMTVGATPETATRGLPGSVDVNEEFDVTITLDATFGSIVEILPENFSYVSCAPGENIPEGGVKPTIAGQEVTLTFFALATPATFTYRVKAPTSPVTGAEFSGVIKTGPGVEEAVGGDSTMDVVAEGVCYRLTIAVSPAEGGTTDPVAGTHSYAANTVVSITATAASGYEFDHWGGDASGISTTTTVTMDTDKTVTTYFIEVPSEVYTLILTCKPSDGGSVTLSPPADLGVYDPSERVTRGTYEADTSIELTATSAEGYVFSCWSGDLSGSASPTNIILDSDKSVIANFVLATSERPASFAVSSLNVSPEQVQPNQRVNISINITNNGEETGSYEAALYINGQLEDSQMVSIPPGSSQNVAFSITRATPGTYAVSLGGQEGQFTVVGRASDAGLDIGSTIAIVGIVVLIAALVFVFRRIRKGT